MRIVLQKLFVVVCLDHKRVHFAQTLNQHLRRIPEVGDETQAAMSSMKRVPYRLDRVVRNGKRLHQDVADSEVGPGAENAPIAMAVESFAANGGSSLCVTIDGDGEFAAEHFKAANMIAVLMGEKHTVELVRLDAALLEPRHNLARA